MSIEETFGNFFKSDVQSSGSKLFSQEKISIASASDTGVHAYVRVAPPFKVQLASSDIASETFTADCNCPVAKKGRLCKHIWGTLLGVAEKYPDFLSAKTTIEKSSASPARAESVQSDAKAAKIAEATKRKEDYAAAAKVRASEYRKDQYQKAKARAKGKKGGGSREEAAPAKSRLTLPAEVEAACTYFSLNGFPMDPGPSEDIANEAKKKLSRVFHPDKGGSHEEIVELNRNWELIVDYLRA